MLETTRPRAARASRCWTSLETRPRTKDHKKREGTRRQHKACGEVKVPETNVKEVQHQACGESTREEREE